MWGAPQVVAFQFVMAAGAPGPAAVLNLNTGSTHSRAVITQLDWDHWPGFVSARQIGELALFVVLLGAAWKS